MRLSEYLVVSHSQLVARVSSLMAPVGQVSTSVGALAWSFYWCWFLAVSAGARPGVFLSSDCH